MKLYKKGVKVIGVLDGAGKRETGKRETGKGRPQTGSRKKTMELVINRFAGVGTSFFEKTIAS